MSFGGSESQWEDEITDDSFNVSVSFSSVVSASNDKKRSHSSLLDPKHPKANRASSILDSLAEDDGSLSTSALSRRPTSPLTAATKWTELHLLLSVWNCRKDEVQPRHYECQALSVRVADVDHRLGRYAVRNRPDAGRV